MSVNFNQAGETYSDLFREYKGKEQYEHILRESDQLGRDLQKVASKVNNDRSSGRHLGTRVVVYPSFWRSPTYYTFINFGGSYTPPPRRGRRGENDDKDALRILVGIVGAIIFGYAAYKLGEAYRRYTDVSEDQKDLMGRLSVLRLNPERFKEGSDQREFAVRLNNLKVAVLKPGEQLKRDALWSVALTISLLAAGALAVAWAITPVGALAITGVALLAIGAGGMLFTWGLGSNDRQKIRQGKEIERCINDLVKFKPTQQPLKTVSDQFEQEPSAPPPPYTPPPQYTHEYPALKEDELPPPYKPREPSAPAYGE